MRQHFAVDEVVAAAVEEAEAAEVAEVVVAAVAASELLSIFLLCVNEWA